MPRFTLRRLISEVQGPQSMTFSDRNEPKVLEYGEADTVLQVSDVHLGYEHSRVEKYNNFLQDVVPQVDPDLLLVTGDFLEFWRSSIENVFIDYQQEIFNTFSAAGDGTDLLFNAGNHDYRFILSSTTADVADEILFSSGGREFKAIHGQQYDPKNANNYTNEGLCLTSEETGELMSDIWDAWKGISPFNPLINRVEYGLPGSISPTGQLQHLSNPDALAQPESSERLDLIEEAVESDNERFVLYGHTHSEMVSEESANAGSFTGNRTPYIVVEDGAVNLHYYD